jgi:hypothetical protein
MQVGEERGRRAFETAGAAAAGRRTQLELIFGTGRGTNAVHGAPTPDQKD